MANANIVSKNMLRNSPESPGDFLPDMCSSYAIFVLILAAEMLALLLAISGAGLKGLNWAQLGLISVEVQWVALVSATLLCYIRAVLARLNPVVAGLLSYALVLTVTFILAVLGQFLLQGIGRDFIDWWQVASHVLMAALLAGIILRYLYIQQQLLNQQQAELRARIQALQSRIQPHFLFNSMNSIASLIAVDQEKAERVVEDLSDLFRASLAQTALVAIKRELALCEGYVRIEKLRLGERLEVIWQIDSAVMGAFIPSLLLQPLLENAIEHGVEPQVQGGQVLVDIYRDDNQLVLCINNPVFTGVAPTSSRPKGNHMALENIQHRLQAHFGKGASLYTENDGHRFNTVIRIDYDASQKNPDNA